MMCENCGTRDVIDNDKLLCPICYRGKEIGDFFKSNFHDINLVDRHQITLLWKKASGKKLSAMYYKQKNGPR